WGWVKPAADDLVVLLGDYVDRGPDTRGVLDRIIELKRQGTKLICLRGNHEVMMLAARLGWDNFKSWLSAGGLQALGSYGSGPIQISPLDVIPRAHWDFLENELTAY